MRKTILLGAAVLTLSLLAACGKSGERDHANGHGSSEASVKPEGHGDHGSGDAEAAGDKLRAEFSFPGGTPKAGEKAELVVRIADDRGEPVEKFQVNHEKWLHLIVVDEDLSYFAHIHPNYRGNGEFAIDATFPSGGKYKAFADFIPEGGANATLSERFEVEGEEESPSAVRADGSLVRTAEGKEVELKLSGAVAGRDAELTFEIRDAKSKKGVNDLEPYLGAVGHVVILSADAEEYLHVHPTDEKSTGPEAKFATRFPHAGTYKIWGQFKHSGKVITVPYVVDVKSR